MEKMTNKKALEFVLNLQEVKGNQEIFDKLSKMLTQVEKKNSTKSDKPTKKQTENDGLKVLFLEVMALYDEPQQLKDFLKNEKFANLDLTPQKLSALAKQMVTEGTIVRIEDKRVTKFAIKPVEVVEEIVEEEVEIVEE